MKTTYSHLKKITTIVVVALTIMIALCMTSCTSGQGAQMYGNHQNDGCAAYN